MTQRSTPKTVQDTKEAEETEELEALDKEAGQPFSGLSATLPQGEINLTAEEIELYKLVYENESFSYRAYDIAKAFTTLQAQEAVKADRKELNIAWIASLAYEAGRVEGIRAERSRRKRGRKIERQ